MGRLTNLVLVGALALSIGTAFAGDSFQRFFKTSVERRYVAVKSPSHIKKEVQTLAGFLTTRIGKKITVNQLLDGVESNYEFYGLERNPIGLVDSAVSIWYKKPNSSLQCLNRRVFGDLSYGWKSDIEDMDKKLNPALKSEKRWKALKKKKEKFRIALDVHTVGYNNGVRCSSIRQVGFCRAPENYVGQMGFFDRAGMLSTLNKTTKIKIDYDFRDGTIKDENFRVTYNGSGRNIVKYVSFDILSTTLDTKF